MGAQNFTEDTQPDINERDNYYIIKSKKHGAYIVSPVIEVNKEIRYRVQYTSDLANSLVDIHGGTVLFGMVHSIVMKHLQENIRYG